MFEQRRDLGLAARDQRHHLGLVAQREADRIVGGGVAGMQRRHHVGAAVRQHRVGDAAGHERHALEAAVAGQRLRAFDQLGAHVDTDDRAAPGRTDHEVVEDEAEIGLAGAEIGDHRVVALGQQRVDRRPQQLHEMQHLLQLAPRVEVQAALARQHVQRLEQRDGTLARRTRPHLRQHLARRDHVGPFAGGGGRSLGGMLLRHWGSLWARPQAAASSPLRF